MENESCPPIIIYQIVIPDKYNYCNTNVDISETEVNTYLSDLISWKSTNRILIATIREYSSKGKTQRSDTYVRLLCGSGIYFILLPRPSCSCAFFSFDIIISLHTLSFF